MQSTSAWMGLALAVGLAACAGADTPSGAEPAENALDADLPEGWANAKPIKNLTQAECDKATSMGVSEAVRWQSSEQSLGIAYDHARFRCAQDVEGFVLQRDELIDVLVQPVDMNPERPVRCDCRYAIGIELTLESGTYDARLYRRSDNINDPNPPVEIGAAEVTVD